MNRLYSTIRNLRITNLFKLILNIILLTCQVLL
uniref:Uncharacterized protein n=1 Tax=Myoviridae sp. ctCo31 TaxID=2825053 RepID=A0A8S5UMP7_9CAUD|nr:MAG TPA: hypothetical protein [Myoviridae sp. ctCo31]